MDGVTPPDVADRYRLVSPLGSGAMATVWLAHDTRLNRDVAVKVLDLSASADPTALERFRREAVATAGLTHPNVVSVFDAGIEANRAYLVMSLVSGRSVADLIREDGPLPIATAVSIGSQVAAALEAAPATGLVHRDIKPANVMVGASGHVTVLDFGIAQLTTSDATLTAPASVIGSAAYMSPEQAAGARVGPASDLYSLGCLMMAMLTGQPPYQGDSAVSVVAMQVNGTPPRLADRMVVPQQLDSLVSRLLDKDPEQRLDAAATAAQLHEVAKHVDLDPVGPTEQDATVAATAVLPACEPTRLAPVVGPAHTSVLPTAGTTVASTQPQQLSPAAQQPSRTRRNRPSPATVSQRPVPPAPRKRRRRVGPAIAVVLILALAGLAFAVGSGRIGPLAALLPATTPSPTPPRPTPATTRPVSRTPSRSPSATPSRTPSATPSRTPTSPSASPGVTLQVAVQTVRGVLVNLPAGPSRQKLLHSWDRESAKILAGDDAAEHLDSFSDEVQEAVSEGHLSVGQGLTIAAALEGVRAAAR